MACRDGVRMVYNCTVKKASSINLSLAYAHRIALQVLHVRARRHVAGRQLGTRCRYEVTTGFGVVERFVERLRGVNYRWCAAEVTLWDTDDEWQVV